MISFLKEIEIKINEKLKPEKVLVIDNSHLHAHHKTFDINKFNLKLIIKSEKLKSMSKIDAHKLIYSILEDEIKSKIHALEIDIL